jgi:hypothetical protein
MLFQTIDSGVWGLLPARKIVYKDQGLTREPAPPCRPEGAPGSNDLTKNV